jgi:hypothetical protein
MSYYKIIRGIAYERSLLLSADALLKGRGDGRISEADMQQLYAQAQDGGRITPVEARTLQYIADTYNSTEAARRWLAEQPKEPKPETSVIEQVIRKRLGLKGLQWDISEEELRRQEALDSQQTFEEALFEGISAILFNSESSTSLRDIVSLETGVEFEDLAEVRAIMKEWVNDGKIFLVPLDYPSQSEAGKLSYFLPLFAGALHEHWTFILEIPSRTSYKFVAQVRRQDFSNSFSFGFEEENPSSAALIERIVEQQFQLPDMDWSISGEEIRSQRKLAGSVDFPEALFEALRSFVFGEEAGETVRNIVKNVHEGDINPADFAFPWDYEEQITRQVREYMNDGELALLPQVAYTLDPDELEDIRLPEDGETLAENWIFQLSLPTLSDHLYWAIVNRKGERPPYHYGFN